MRRRSVERKVVVAQNEQDLAAERGLSSFDQRQRFTGDYTVDLPFGEGRKWMTSPGPLNKVLGDWTWSGTFTIASGFPFTANVLGNFADVARGTNGTLRANLVPGEAISISNPSINQWFNTGAFVDSAGGTVRRQRAQHHHWTGNTSVQYVIFEELPDSRNDGLRSAQ